MTGKFQIHKRPMSWPAMVGVVLMVGSLTGAMLIPGALAQTTVAAPSIDPMGGNHTDMVIVTMETETAGAEIRYTFDPLSPENTWTTYTGPIQLGPDQNSQVIRAKAYLGNESSDLTQAAFNVFDSTLTGKIEEPDVTPLSGTYFNPVQVTVDGHTSPPFKIRQLHITTDGTDPRPYSNTGSGQSSPQNLTISTSTTVKAIATQLGWANSDVVSRQYVLQCASPVITAADASNDDQTITMSTETNNAEIRYTTDGSEPTAGSSPYAAPFDVGADVFDINARCFRSEFEPSPIVTRAVNERPAKFCAGLEVTVDLAAKPPGVPTGGADVILGTDGDDVINALGGDDVVCARGGNDTIDAGDGNDVVFADAGLDVVVGGSGNDTLWGGADRDILRGGPGVDTAHGEGGNDRVLGGVGNDILTGGDGNDYLGGFGGSDTIDGGPGDETIFGGFGADIINGGPGNDRVFGLIGDDTIMGGAGDDTLNGDRGNDTIDGGLGNDTIAGGNANDILRGNDGDDIVSGGKADDMLSGNDGDDTCSGNREHDGDTADDTCERIFGVP